MINLLEKLLGEMDKKVFIGNCVTGLEDPQFQDMIAGDATVMAQLVEGGEEITKDDFLKICHVDPEILEELNMAEKDDYVDDYEFYYNRDKNIAWYYDTLEDVEYFYV